MMISKCFTWFLLCVVCISSSTTGQNRDSTSIIDGELVRTSRDGEGQELLTKQLREISVTSKRKFASKEEEKLYGRYKYYALQVYPYATQAIRIFRSSELESEGMSRRQKRKFYKKKHKELKEEFEDPLKDLSKTQGRILVHMIERELDTPLHYLIKRLRNGVKATYWSTLGGLYGYHLKKGYIRGEDPILDMVLDDLDLSYSSY